jgi:hypothetical protein
VLHLFWECVHAVYRPGPGSLLKLFASKSIRASSLLLLLLLLLLQM